MNIREDLNFILNLFEKLSFGVFLCILNCEFLVIGDVEWRMVENNSYGIYEFWCVFNCDV